MSTKLGRMYRSKEDGLNDIELKRSILEMDIKLETLCRILIDKGLVTRSEINRYRIETMEDHKYGKKIMDINLQRKNILDPPVDPVFKAMVQSWIEHDNAKTVAMWPTFKG